MRAHGKKGKPDSLYVKGTFATELYPNFDDLKDIVLTLDGQDFTIPAEALRLKNTTISCKSANVREGGVATAVFNYAKCTFSVTIKKTLIGAAPGESDFSITTETFNNFSEAVNILLQ